jgi:hypothetical protein
VRRCAVQRAKGQTSQSYPLSDFISFIHSIPSSSSLPCSSILPHHSPCCQFVPLCSYRPLKSAFDRLPPPPQSAPIWLPFIPPRMEFLPHPQLPHLLVHPAEHSYSHLDHYTDERFSRFPTSEDRFEGTATSSFGSLLYPSARYDPLGSLTKDEHALARKALCSSFNPLFFPRSVSRGVLSDGTWTTEHPSVHAFLQTPSSRPDLTSTTSAAIYSLAALHVFYNPSHPSYDVFWHPDIKEATATFVHEVISKRNLLSSHFSLS